MVVCLEQGADLHMVQLMPLPLTVTCFSKIQIGFTLLVPAHLGSPGKRAVKRVCVCVCSSSSNSLGVLIGAKIFCSKEWESFTIMLFSGSVAFCHYYVCFVLLLLLLCA